MKNCFTFGLAVMALCSLFVAPACRQQPQSRRYEENGPDAAPAPALPQGEAWHWAKPVPWREEGNAGLRLATFSIAGQEGPGQCTLVPLPGDGGGIEANVQRWLEQLQLPLFSPREMADFLGRQKRLQTRDGLPVAVIDFTALGRRQPPAASMLAAMIADGNQTLFVKLSGGKALIEKNREDFYEFCRSLSRGT